MNAFKALLNIIGIQKKLKINYQYTEHNSPIIDNKIVTNFLIETYY